MRSKLFQFKTQLQYRLVQAKSVYQEFRLYDFGSYALNRLTPRQGYTVENDLAYGANERHQLDLYRTAQPRPQQPLIVFVHGGAWSRGDKKIIALLEKLLPNKVLMLPSLIINWRRRIFFRSILMT